MNRPAPIAVLRPGRAGFTLVEILLVITLLAVLAAAAVPAALRVFDDYALKESGEAIRDDLARARLSAVQEGIEYHFRVEPNGTRWVVIPGERDVAADPDAPPAYVPVRSGQLPSEVTFVSDAPASQIGGQLDPSLFEGLPDGAALAQLQWSDPLVFLPDGTAAGGTVTVGDDEQRVLSVAVRPLTGAASVGDIGSANPTGTRR